MTTYTAQDLDNDQITEKLEETLSFKLRFLAEKVKHQKLVLKCAEEELNRVIHSILHEYEGEWETHKVTKLDIDEGTITKVRT
jgi:hypothetical protein